MRLIKTNMRRGIALLLVSAMLITSVSMGAAIGTKAVRSAQTVSFGSLIADNALELGDAEKGILRSGLLAGDTFTYISPDNSDGLIAVDPDAKKITVSPYTDELGNMWTAAVCRIVYDGGKETVALIDGEGRFEYDGSSYAAEADYKLTVSAGDPTFTEKLLKAPYMLAKGVDNLNVLCSYNVQMPLDVLAQNKDLLQIAADGFDLYAPDGSSMGHVDLPCKPNAQNLLKQYNANGGKFDLKVRGDECIAAAAKTAYLISGGQNIKKAAADTYKDFSAIYADLTNSFYQSAMVAYQIATQETIDIMCTTLSKWLATVKPVAEDSWAILENTDVLAEGLTDAQYAELDTLIAADATLADRPFNGAVPETLTVNTSTVEAEVNRYAVTVQVLARVVDRETKDSAELTALPAETAVIKMIPGSTGAEILSRVEASGVEESALAGWDSFYGVNEDNYIRSVSVDLTEDYTLEGNITYTITYTPRTLTVTYGEGYGEGEKTPAEVPYGYQMKLPAYNGDLVYDYTVNGSEADQGDVVRITGNTYLSRVTGKAWNYYGIGKLVSGNYATGDTVAQNILTSTALRTGTFRLRTPGNADGLLSMDSSTGVYTVTAKAFKADTGDLWWIPETGTLKGGEADGTAISFTLADGINYTAEF
ncbi:MAG: hypothetical protein PUC29_04175, partial [Clostridia bacterium]|nr:hypothetical protein [Clostridia bacterium]